MAKTKIEAGVCGFTTEVEALADDMQVVSFTVNSNCARIKKLAERLPKLDAYAELGADLDGELYKAVKADPKPLCAGCVVPVALFKSMQVAAGLSLPKDVVISISR